MTGLNGSAPTTPLDELGGRGSSHGADAHGVWAYRPASPLPGRPSGPLHGLTFSVKDLYGVPGWPLTASTRAAVPDPDESVLVRRLLNAGASAVGKTHLHEIALGTTGMNAFGGTRHPLHADRVPGGSSSGAAVSVALGQVDFALGTDTGGSIRTPAAWCGVVGFKPSRRHLAWSTRGVVPLSWSCDHAGPLAPDVRTVVRVHEALTGTAVPEVTWAGVRVGLWLPDAWVDDTVREDVLAVAADLRARGAVLDRVEFPDVLDAYAPIVTWEAAQVHAEELRKPAPAFLPGTLEILRRGAALSDREVMSAFERRQEYRAVLDGLLLGFDVLLAPTVPTPPPLIGQAEVAVREGMVPLRTATLRLTAPFSLLGVPAVAVPSGTPGVGVQFVAGAGRDEYLLGLVRALAH